MPLSKNTDIVKTLHPLEKKVLPFISDKKFFSDIVDESSMKDIEVMRALQWLQNKGILKIEETTEEIVSLDKNGMVYKEKGLPERRFLESIRGSSLKSPIQVQDILDGSSIDKQELNICLGLLKKKVAIEIIKKEGLSVYLTDQGKKMLSKSFLEEKFLQRSFPVSFSELDEESLYAYKELSSRKQIVKKEMKKSRYVVLTSFGKDLVKKLSSMKLKDEIGRITPEILSSSSWKGKDFRSYDVRADVPPVYPGKMHFVNQAIRYIKQIWLEMGFEEMTGNHVQTAFRDLDALFVPQDHPAREEQDTFYIENPKEGKLPASLKKAVKEMHEHGGGLNSKGWESKYSEKIAKQNLLRTHTTVLSAEYITGLKQGDLPKKYFSVGKVYRNEALDWKHLFEFYQVEGIVVDPDANLKHLIGYLSQFYKKLGYEKVRIRPGYFPYTEPSLEVEVFHPKKKQWIELGGAGIFRPEVVKPLLGKAIPVLAWGQGMERSIVEYFGLNNLRDLYSNDIKQMKEMKYWMK